MDDKKKKIVDELFEDDFFAPPKKEEKKIEKESKKVEGEKREEKKSEKPSISIEDFDDFFVSPEEHGAPSPKAPETVSVEDLSLLESELLKEKEEKKVEPKKEVKIPSEEKIKPPLEEKLKPPVEEKPKISPGIDEFIVPPPIEDRPHPPQKVEESPFEFRRRERFIPPVPPPPPEKEVVEVRVLNKTAFIGAMAGGFVLGSIFFLTLQYLGILNLSPQKKERAEKVPAVEKEKKVDVAKLEERVVPPPPPPAEKKVEESLPPSPQDQPAPQIPPPPQPAVKSLPEAVLKETPPPPPESEYILEIGPISDESSLKSVIELARSLNLNTDVKSTTKTEEKFIVVNEYPNEGKAKADQIKIEVLAGIKDSRILTKENKVYLVLGEYREITDATAQKNKLQGLGINARIDVEKREIKTYTVKAGKFVGKSSATSGADKFKKMGFRVSIKSL